MKANWFRRFLLWQVCLLLIWIIPTDLFSQTAIQTNSLCTGAKLSIINNPQRIKKIEWHNGPTLVHTWTRDHQVVAGIAGTGGLTLNTLPGPFGLLREPNGALTVGEYVSARVIQFPPGSVSGTPGTIIAGGNFGGTALNQVSALDLARDAAGNLYIPDVNNYRVLRFPPGSDNTTLGTIVAGTGAAGVELDKVNSPAGIAVDAAGFLYVSDRHHHRVLRFPPGSTAGATGTLVAGGHGMGNGLDQLNSPHSIRITPTGDLLIADANNYRIMRWMPGAPTGTIVAGGNGNGAAPNQLSDARYFYEDNDHNLYVSDQLNHRIQKWAPGATEGITVAGGYGTGPNPWQMPGPMGITFDADSNMYVNSFTRYAVVKFAPAFYIATQPGTYTAVVTFEDNTTVTAAGNITINSPGSFGVSIHASTNTFIPGAPISFTPVPVNLGGAPTYQWKVNGNPVTTGATFTSSTLQEGDIVTCDMTAPSPCTFVPEVRGSNSITLKTKKVPTLTAGSNCSGATLQVNTHVPITRIQWYRDNILIATADTTRTIRTFAGGNGPGGSPTQLNHPLLIRHHTDGYVYVTDLFNHRVLKYPPNATGATAGIVVAGGNGPGAALNQLNGPTGLAFDAAGNLYVTDLWNYRVLKFPPNSDGTTFGTVVAGGNGVGDGLNQLQETYGIEVDAAGNVYVSDYDGRRVLRFPPGSTSATYGMVVAGGNGVGAGLNKLDPSDLALDDWGNLYFADVTNARILQFTPGATSGLLLAGGNGAGPADNQVGSPWGLARDQAGNLYVSESINQRVRVWKPGAPNGQYWAGPNGLGFPHGLDVDSLGNTWIVDRLNHRIQYYELVLNRELVTTQSGTYKAVVTALDGTVTTTADITILSAEQPAITITASPAAFTPGSNMTFTAMLPYGGANPTYQWRVNGNPVVPGPVFSSTTLQEGDIVTCSLTASIPCSGVSHTVLSNSITLKEKKKPTLTATTTCTGGTLRINHPAPVIKVQWYRDNVLIQTADTTRVTRIFAGGPGDGNGLHQLNSPFGLCLDNQGNLYVADELNNRVLKFPPNSTNGTAGIVVAGGNGAGTALNQLLSPIAVRVDAAGNLFVAEYGNSRILKFPPGSTAATFGQIVAGGNGYGNARNQFSNPYGLALDDAGNIFVADFGNNRIMRFPPGSNATTLGTLVAGGNGPGGQLNQVTPAAIAIDAMGNIFLGEETQHRVTQWAPGATAGILRAGGNGWGNAPNTVSLSRGISLDADGNLYTGEAWTHRVQVWKPGATSGELIGGGTLGTGVGQMNYPQGIITDSLGNTWVAERNNHRIHYFGMPLDRELPLTLPGTYKAVVTTLDGTVATTSDIVIGDSRPREVTIAAPYTTVLKGTALTFTAAVQNGGSTPQLQWKVNGNNVATGVTYTSSTLNNGDVVTCELTAAGNACVPAGTVPSNALTLTIGDAPTLAGSTNCPGSTLTVSSQLAVQKIEWYKDNALVSTTYATWTGSTVAGGNGAGTATNQTNAPFGLCLDQAGNRYVVEWGNHRVLKFPPNSTGATNGIIAAGGNGPGNALNQLQNPTGIIMDGQGYLYVSDYNNQRVLKFPPNSTGATNGTIVAGGNGPGNTLRQFRFPTGLWLDGHGHLYVSDRDNHRILRFPPGSTQFTDGEVVAGGNGAGAGLNQLNTPNNVSMDAQGNLLISEISNNRITRWTPGATTGTVVAGGNGPGANLNQISYPNSVIADISGNLYIVDRANHRLLQWAPGAATGTLIVGGPAAGTGAEQFNLPVTARRDREGNFIVTDMSNNRVQLFTPALTPTYTAAASGTYKAIATTIDGQTTTTADVVIATQQIPAVTIATPQTSICAGSPVTFTATPALAGTAPTYQWKLNGGDVTGTGNTYSASTLANGDIISCVLTASADAGCVASPTATSNAVTMTILNAPAMAPITGTATLCAQGTAQLLNLTLNATGVWKSLSPAVATISNTGLMTGVAAGTAVIRYIATSSSGCTDSTQTTVTIQPLNTPSITVQSSATTVCTGSSVTFTAAGNGAGTIPAYQWQVNGTANGITTTQFTSSSLQQGDVITCVLTAGADAGCVTSPTATSTPITLTVNALPAVRPISGAAILCTNGTAQLANATPGVTSQWKSLHPLIATVDANGLVTALTAGNALIRYIATTPAGCQDSTDRLVTVHTSVNPAIVIQATYHDTCAGAPISFEALGTEGGTQPHYQWQVNGSPAGTGAWWTTGSLKNNDVITCVLTSNATCASSTTVTSTPLTPTIYPLPIVDAGPDKTIIKGDLVKLDGQASGTSSLQWTPPAGLQQAGTATPVASPAVTTTYRLEGSTNKGCTASDAMTVTVLPSVRIANAFSPNGDGIHDTWELSDLRFFPQAEIQVFNRYGQQVYTTRGYQPGRGWNGTLNGYILPAGTYYYVIDLKNGKPQLSGPVTLIK